MTIQYKTYEIVKRGNKYYCPKNKNDTGWVCFFYLKQAKNHIDLFGV